MDIAAGEYAYDPMDFRYACSRPAPSTSSRPTRAASAASPASSAPRRLPRVFGSPAVGALRAGASSPRSPPRRRGSVTSSGSTITRASRRWPSTARRSRAERRDAARRRLVPASASTLKRARPRFVRLVRLVGSRLETKARKPAPVRAGRRKCRIDARLLAAAAAAVETELRLANQVIAGPRGQRLDGQSRGWPSLASASRSRRRRRGWERRARRRTASTTEVRGSAPMRAPPTRCAKRDSCTVSVAPAARRISSTFFGRRRRSASCRCRAARSAPWPHGRPKRSTSSARVTRFSSHGRISPRTPSGAQWL